MDRMTEIEQEGTKLFLKHNNAFAMAFDALPEETQEEYKALYLKEYGQPYVNRY